MSKHLDIDWAPGVYELEDGMRLIIQEYLSKDQSDCLWETHLEYIDLQFLQRGSERIDAAHVNKLRGPEPYDVKSDKIRYSGGEGVPLEIDTDSFIILFPQDGHKCCISVSEPVHVRKLCLKIPVSLSI